MTRNQALLAWYREHGRPLPWRGSPDPWVILVSEVMSQQTQVERVVKRFTPFMAAFPTPGALASSPPERAVEMWADLGYLRRLHSLRRAATMVAERGWPADLTELPGVGPYTAAAVASFAFGQPVPAVDTNHRRVLSRWVGRPLQGRDLTGQAVTLIDRTRAASWNQAVMDLGALVCRPVPICSSCPVLLWCADPGVYEPPPRQSTYSGSLRQARAAVIKELSREPQSSTTALGAVLATPRLEEALVSLVRDSMIAGGPDGWSLT